MILVVLIFLSTLGYTIYRLEDADFLVSQARSVNLYARLSNEFGQVLPANTNFIFKLTDDETKQILTYAIDGQTFYDFLGQYLKVNVDYLSGKTSDYNFSYDLTAVKNRAQDKATEITLARYNDLPVCQSNQLHSWNASTAFPVCQLPSDASLSQDDVNGMLTNQVGSYFTSSSGLKIGNTFTLTQPSDRLAAWRSTTTRVTHGIYLIWLATLAFLFLYLLILRRRAFWSLAFIFIIVGLLQIAFSFIAWGWLARTIADLFANTGAKQVSSAIADIAEVTMDVLKTIMGTLSIYTLGAGGAMLLLAIYTSLRKPKILPV